MRYLSWRGVGQFLLFDEQNPNDYNTHMKRFLLFLALSISLLIIWVLTYSWGHYPAQPHLYVQAAPFWHIGLFFAWFCIQVYAGVCFVYWLWGHQSRRQHFPQQPPNHAR